MLKKEQRKKKRQEKDKLYEEYQENLKKVAELEAIVEESDDKYDDEELRNLKETMYKYNIKQSKRTTMVCNIMIIVAIVCCIISLGSMFKSFFGEHNKLKVFYQEQENLKEIKPEDREIMTSINISDDYIAAIKIDKIGLEKGLYSINSPFNTVDNNIQILSNSSMPDVEKGNMILVSHNGNTEVSYFRKLYKLIANDKVSIFYNGYEYQYKVTNTYKVKKSGKVNIVRNKEKTTLTLITCSGNEEQLIVVCELIKKV